MDATLQTTFSNSFTCMYWNSNLVHKCKTQVVLNDLIALYITWILYGASFYGILHVFFRVLFQKWVVRDDLDKAVLKATHNQAKAW